MKKLLHKIAETKEKLTSRAGLLVVADLMQCLGLPQMADCLMLVTRSNLGYLPEELFQTFILMLHEVGRCLDDEREVCQEEPLMKLLGRKLILSACTLGKVKVLRRMGRSQPAQQVI